MRWESGAGVSYIREIASPLTGIIIGPLELENLRSYHCGKFQFPAGSNLLYGDDAQGETNLLEALYYYTGGKSYRAGKGRELIRLGETEAYIKLLPQSGEIPHQIGTHLRKSGTEGTVMDGIPLWWASKLYRIVRMVVSSSEDSNLIKSGPAEYGRLLDMELCQLNRHYIKELLQCNRALQQRNKLLKGLVFRPSLLKTLDLWDAQLVSAGATLIQSCVVFLEQLNEICVEKYAALTGEHEQLHLSCGANVSEDYFTAAVKKNQEFDLRQKTSSVGPHRDDITFYLQQGEEEEMDSRKFGSQG